MLDNYKNNFVEVAQEVNSTLLDLSQRSRALSTTSMEEVETAEQKELKEKLSYNSTYSIFDFIKRHLTKFMSNKVNREFDIGASEKKNFIEYLTKIDYEQIVKTVINKGFNEPNDFILIEKDLSGLSVVKFIPINSVYYYDDITLIYELDISTKEEKVYRKIEYTTYKEIAGWWDFILRQNKDKDRKLVISQKKGEKPQVFGFNETEILQEKPFNQITELVYENQVKDCYIFSAVEKLKIYSRDSDIFETSKVQHAFPEKITIAFDCLKCSGTGEIKNGANGSYKCDACNGTGKYWVRNPSEVLKIPQLIPNDMKPYMSEVVKYVEKDIKTLEFQKENLKQLEEEITLHTTGLKNIAVNSLKTATEVQENQIPLNARINEIIGYVQNVEIWMLTVLGKLYTDKFKSVNVIYQLLYTGRTEEDIIAELKRGKDIGLNFTWLKSLFTDWIRAYYRNEPIKMNVQLKLADIEPYPFYTIKELKENEILLNPEQLHIKIELQNYINQLDLSKNANEIRTDFLKIVPVLIKEKENESINSA